jgi:hypothetical protein
MSHFAEIKDGVVQRVIVAEQDFINTGVVGDSFNWVQTSYNGNFRKQFAGRGYTYDKVNDVFIQPATYPSWVLDENFDWQPPVPKPEDYIHNPPTGASGGHGYVWNEDTQEWIEIT